MERRRAAATAAVVGGALWAATPLRQPVFGAGRTPDEGEVFFRGYNVVLVVIGLLLTAALVELRRRARGTPGSGPRRAFRAGWWTVLAGHALLIAGSGVGVVLGGALPDVVMLGQDVGFAGAVIAALGALPLGIGGRRGGVVPTAAAVLFAATLPLGVLGTVAMTALGAPEDVLGLPSTVLYGGAWVAFGAAVLGGGARAGAGAPARGGRPAP